MNKEDIKDRNRLELALDHETNRYLYTKMEESPESFGSALKEADLSNDDMLRLLWLAAKREAIEKEMGPVDPEQGQLQVLRRQYVRHSGENLERRQGI